MVTKTRETTLEQIDAALAALAPGRMDLRDEWIRVGMALHSHDSGEAMLERWKAVSAQSDKYDEHVLVRTWYSFKSDHGVTIATLFHMAREDGWKPERADEAPANGAAPAPQARQDRETPPRTAPDKGKAKKPQFWADLETAKREFEKLPRVIDDERALEFFAEEYGILDEMDLCDGVFAEWRVMQWPGGLTIPRGERVVVYPGVTPTGQPGFKVKTVQRIEKRENRPPKRASRWLYRPDSPTGPQAFHVKRPGSPLVIVGGEEKAVVAYASGYSVLAGLDGEGNLISPRKTGRDGQPISDGAETRWAEWVAEADPPAVVIAMDADDAGRKATDQISTAIADAGYPRLQIHRIAWPEGLPAGWDLNDAKKAGQDVRAIVSEAEAVQRERLTVLNLDQIEQFKHTADDNLLGAFMLTRGGPRVSLMIGPPGVGKSRLAMQMAIDVTCGFEFCGLESHGKGTRWLFFQAENTPRRLKYDLGHMLRGSKDEVRRAVAENIWFLAPMGEYDSFLNFGVAGVAERMIDAVKAYNPDVIVWDPLIEFFGGESENANVEMKSCVSQMVRISRARRPDTAVLILAHASPGKSSAAKAYGFDAGHFHRGATSLIGAAGASFNIAPADEDDPSRLILACGKCSDGPKFEARGIVLDPDRMRYDVDPEFDLEQWKEATRGNWKPSNGRKWDAAVVMSRVPMTGSIAMRDLIDTIKETNPGSPNTWRTRIRKLEEEGQIDIFRREDLKGKPDHVTRKEGY